MTPLLNSNHTYTISHSFLHTRRASRPASPQRTSPVLTAQELRRIVCQMVD